MRVGTGAFATGPLKSCAILADIKAGFQELVLSDTIPR